jgi:hypothetical protein
MPLGGWARPTGRGDEATLATLAIVVTCDGGWWLGRPTGRGRVGYLGSFLLLWRKVVFWAKHGHVNDIHHKKNGKTGGQHVRLAIGQ